MTFSDLLSNITSIINDCILPFIIEFFSSGIGLLFVTVTTFMVVLYCRLGCYRDYQIVYSSEVII